MMRRLLFTRLSDLGVPSYLMTSTVLGVMAQRLVRVLCPACKEKQVLEDSAWELLVSPWKAQKPTRHTSLKAVLSAE
jgi:general secretion pathway protein E